MVMKILLGAEVFSKSENKGEKASGRWGKLLKERGYKVPPPALGDPQFSINFRLKFYDHLKSRNSKEGQVAGGLENYNVPRYHVVIAGVCCTTLENTKT